MPAPYRACLDRRARHDGPPARRPGSGSIRPRRGPRAGARARAPSAPRWPTTRAHAEQGRDAAIAGGPARRLRRRCSPTGLGRPIDVATMMGAIALRGLSRRRAGPARLARAAACGSSASPTGTTSSATSSSGSASPARSTGSSPRPPPECAQAGPGDLRGWRCGSPAAGRRGVSRRRQRRGRRGRPRGGHRRDQDRPRTAAATATYPRSPRSRAAGPDGQNDVMSEPEQPTSVDPSPGDDAGRTQPRCRPRAPCRVARRRRPSRCPTPRRRPHRGSPTGRGPAASS